MNHIKIFKSTKVQFNTICFVSVNPADLPVTVTEVRIKPWNGSSGGGILHPIILQSFFNQTLITLIANFSCEMEITFRLSICSNPFWITICHQQQIKLLQSKACCNLGHPNLTKGGIIIRQKRPSQHVKFHYNKINLQI